MKNVNRILVVFAFFGFWAVAIGAFGAHALKGKLTPESLIIFETGNKYHFYHTLAGLLVISLCFRSGGEIPKYWIYSLNLFAFGIFIFAGSLYALAITGIKILGAITPIGGFAFLLGWICFGIGSYHSFRTP